MPTIEERALALVNEICEERGEITYGSISRTGKNIAGNEALCRALETLDAERAAHAQFRQEVSDAVEEYMNEDYRRKQGDKVARIISFILPKPVDPLVEAIREASVSDADDGDASRLRAALAARGGKIVWENANAR